MKVMTKKFYVLKLLAGNNTVGYDAGSGMISNTIESAMHYCDLDAATYGATQIVDYTVIALCIQVNYTMHSSDGIILKTVDKMD